MKFSSERSNWAKIWIIYKILCIYEAASPTGLERAVNIPELKLLTFW